MPVLQHFFLQLQSRQTKSLISISNAPDKEQQNVPSSGSLNLADFDSSQQINGSRTDIMEILQPVKIPNEVETIVENTSIHPPMPYINVELEKMIVDATKGQNLCIETHSVHLHSSQCIFEQAGSDCSGSGGN
ncbi:MAG: hypothetical protein IPL69_19630 [Saprospiraceae bacterium]|nr:hypothetical protein [Candidatus Brachybacter algidus]